MNILYVSTYNDEKFFKYVFDTAKIKPIQSIQKFNKLLVTGFEQNKYVDKIFVLTTANIGPKMSKKLFWKGKNKKINKTEFIYLPFLNIKFLKQMCIAFFGFIYLLYWCILNHRKESILISDGFFPVVSTIANLLCKIFKIPVVTLYTDLIKIPANDKIEKKSILRIFVKKILSLGDIISINTSDMFIFLTEHMTNVINKKNKPYIVIEGLVDSELTITSCFERKKAIMYAGGLYEKYGVKLLIDSFLKWDNNEYELWLCGTGDLDSYILSLNNSRIKYFGAIQNEIVVQKEQECMLLVNPRFSNEEYTMYSFPSKNMEYMMSGTPVLTTRLPGIPKEYNKYIYFIEQETEEGLINEFNKILLTNEDFLKTGKKAQKFVRTHKNNIVQSNKIVSFIMDKLN